MELQWPLILFTTLLAASAGLFATQGVYAFVGRGKAAQLPSLYISAALLVVGGIAVFLHLQHWDRIFNGFGHLTSGITQELIAIVFMAIVMVLTFVMLRRNDGEVPKWCSIAAIVVAAVLVLVMGLSYLMAARPAWNNALQVLSLYGAALAAGTGLFALIDRTSDQDSTSHEKYTLIATIINLAFTCIFIIMMASTSGQFIDVGNYFDPNHPTQAMASASDYSPISPETIGFTVAAIIAAIGALACSLYGKKSKQWVVAGAGVAICAIVGAALLRAVFFLCGGSIFMFY